MRKQYVITMERSDRERFEQKFQALSNSFEEFIYKQTNSDARMELWGMKRELDELAKIVE